MIRFTEGNLKTFSIREIEVKVMNLVNENNDDLFLK